MLFSEPCKTGQLQIDESTVQLMAPFQQLLWSTPRKSVTYIGLETGPTTSDLTIYTSQYTFPASSIEKQSAWAFCTFFPGVPVGSPVPPVQQPASMDVSSSPSWQAASSSGTVPLPESHPELASPSQPSGDLWQRPQQPLPDYTQQTPAPGQFPQYQQYPYGQMPYQRQPQRRPPRLSNRSLIIIVAIVVVLVIIIGSISSISSAIQNNSTSAQATSTADAQQTACCAAPTPAPTDISTQAPTIAPTAKPKPTLGSQTAVGNTVDAFTAKFGSPTNQTSDANGGTTYQFQNVGNTVGTMNVITYPNSQTLVFGVVLGPPTGQSWDATTALTNCIAFVPEDGKIDTPKVIRDTAGIDVGLYQSGSSVELANTLPSSDFIDADTGNLVKPGTFSTMYSYAVGSNGTQVDACAIQVGVISTKTLSQS